MKLGRRLDNFNARYQGYTVKDTLVRERKIVFHLAHRIRYTTFHGSAMCDRISGPVTQLVQEVMDETYTR
jgi:hypothetical protein